MLTLDLRQNAINFPGITMDWRGLALISAKKNPEQTYLTLIRIRSVHSSGKVNLHFVLMALTEFCFQFWPTFHSQFWSEFYWQFRSEFCSELRSELHSDIRF